ncbi:hypothetical protein CDD82_4647 [Ophiocordyceps australis]|uniref:Chromo domain-containing protein n=1 Tax=Ophiocordyceps australis TaxID=1399860 RepID=A0A2C5Z5I7_9HYPO|nr:hypothetical protein CDD82_4647 [Ophiocordyceps australis]
MPPALSEDEASDMELQHGGSSSQSVSPDQDEVIHDAAPTSSKKGARKQKVEQVRQEEEGEEEEEEEEEEDDDGDDLDEDEFIVESIKKHMVDVDGTLKFLVKWEGWDKKTDMTWEPEENLKESASEILEAYLESIGGRDSIFEETEKAVRSKKRSRASGGATPASAKRSRKNGTHPSEMTPPATSKKWSPPAGSWEDEIETIDACEAEGNGKLVVYLIWKNGRKTRHDTSIIYKKCPQKMLQFYERHVKIIRDEKAVEEA